MFLITTGIVCQPVLAELYVDPNNEFIVADPSTYERSPKISGSNVTWNSRPSPSSGKLDVYYRILPDGLATNITNDPIHDQYYSDVFSNTIVYDDSIQVVMAYTIGGGTSIVSGSGGLPRVCWDLIVWEDNRSGSNDI